MYHSRWKGSHYEAGLKYGERLRKFNIDLRLGERLNEGKLKYAREVKEIYEEFYPEIIQEIRGFSDGLKVDFQSVFSFLTTMYVFTFDNYCSCLGISNNENILLGRNSDFDIRIEKLTDSVLYKLDTGFSFIGNTTAMIQMEDGINERGLACGLTFVYPTVKDLGLNAGFLVRYILEKCQTVEEAYYFLENVKIASSQNIIVVDSAGGILYAELNAKEKYLKILSSEDKLIFTTNHFNSDKMNKYKYDGMDDIFSHTRYETLRKENFSNYDHNNLRKLLSGDRGFICQYDREKGFDIIWSRIYDIDKKNL